MRYTLSTSELASGTENRKIGERLQRARQKVGLSRTHVAKVLGTTYRRIWYMEVGHIPIPSTDLKALAKLYQVPASKLLGAQ